VVPVVVLYCRCFELEGIQLEDRWGLGELNIRRRIEAKLREGDDAEHKHCA